KLLNKNPDERYANATILMNDLNRAILEPNMNFNQIQFDENAPTQITPIIKENDDIKETNKSKVDDNKLKENKKSNKSNKRKIWLLVLSLLGVFLLASILGALVFSFSDYFNVKEVKIPNVENLSIDNAIKILNDNNLQYEIKERRNSNEV